MTNPGCLMGANAACIPGPTANPSVNAAVTSEIALALSLTLLAVAA